MARTPDSSLSIKGLYMQAVKAGESAERILKTKEVSSAQRGELLESIKQGERAKGFLRKAGVKI